MPVRDDRERLQDILKHIASVERHIEGMSDAEFVADERTSHAVRYCIGIIGEAVRALSDSLTQRHPEVPWKPIGAMRNFLFHVYWATDDQILWDTVKADLDPLKQQVTSILAGLPDDQ